MEIQKANNQLAARSATLTLPQRLQDTILRLGDSATRSMAKLDLMDITSELMPAGSPRFTEIVNFPMIRDMVTGHGRPRMLLMISIIVRDFCSSVNVVRNMNEDQIIEAASMLLDECGNFRLEDYTMMFAMSKRGQLIKIYDRIDIQVITDILDAYWKKRHEAGKKAQEEDVHHLDGLGPVTRQLDGMHPMDAALGSLGDNLTGALGEMKAKWLESMPLKGLDEAKTELHKNPEYRNPFPEPNPRNT